MNCKKNKTNIISESDRISEMKVMNMLENATFSHELLEEMKLVRSSIYTSLAAAGVSYDGTKPSNRNYSDSKVETLILRAEKIDKRILEETSRIINVMDYLTHLINTMPEYRHRIVIIKKYIDNKTTEQIAEEIGYSNRHIQRLLNEAVKMLARAHETNELRKTNHSAKT